MQHDRIADDNLLTVAKRSGGNDDRLGASAWSHAALALLGRAHAARSRLWINRGISDRTRLAGGAYYVDDAEIGKIGSCEIESWGSFAANSDRIGVFSPACVVDLGRPVELGT